MSGSGAKAILINSRERAISPDANRAQAFEAAQVAEVVRWLMLTHTDKTQGNGLATPIAAITSPLGAVVFNGVMPVPVNGTVSMTITEGMLAAYFPETPAVLDDSPVKVVKTAGMQTLGVLPLTPNASGSIRVDIIECRPKFQTFETDNRDVFDPSTGLFAAVTVDKVRGYELEYRIRAGTPAAGFPGTALGWLPLAVAIVPNGSVVWDTVTLFDVRPMAVDRAVAPFDCSDGVYRVKENKFWGEGNGLTNALNVVTLRGYLDATHNGWNIGGTLPDLFDLNAVTVREPLFNWAGTFWNLYLVTPFGLPRWVKYGPAPIAPRTPNGIRGIPITSLTTPNNQGIGAALSFPPIYGFAAATSDGVAVATGSIDALTMYSVISDGRMIVTDSLNPIPVTLQDNVKTRWLLSLFNETPSHARRVRLEMTLTFTGILNSQGLVRKLLKITDAAFATTYGILNGDQNAVAFINAGSYTVSFSIEIPVDPTILQTGIEWNHSDFTPQGWLVTASSLHIRGYDVTEGLGYG